jgi:hypothetical protein
MGVEVVIIFALSLATNENMRQEGVSARLGHLHRPIQEFGNPASLSASTAWKKTLKKGPRIRIMWQHSVQQANGAT